MGFWSRIAALTAAWAIVGCEEPRKPTSSCPEFSGEFADEQAEICRLDEMVSALSPDTTRGEVCDMIAGIQEEVASIFLYDDWVHASPDTTDLYNRKYPFLEAFSPVFVPKNSLSEGVKMQCTRSILYSDEDESSQRYLCRTSVPDPYQSPVVNIEVLVRNQVPRILWAGYARLGYTPKGERDLSFGETARERWVLEPIMDEGNRVLSSISDDEGDQKEILVCDYGRERYQGYLGLMSTIHEFNDEKIGE